MHLFRCVIRTWGLWVQIAESLNRVGVSPDPRFARENQHNARGAAAACFARRRHAGGAVGAAGAYGARAVDESAQGAERCLYPFINP